MFNNIYGNIDILSKALGASWKRNEVLANNVANVNTPNFKRSDVEFEKLLKGYLEGNKVAGVTTHEKHIPIGTKDVKDLNYRVVKDMRYSTRRDGNNVDIDVETAEFAKNSILYNTLITRLNGNIQRLKLVINEGKR